MLSIYDRKRIALEVVKEGLVRTDLAFEVLQVAKRLAARANKPGRMLSNQVIQLSIEAAQHYVLSELRQAA